MAYNERKMLEDVNGDLIPQYYDPVEDVFKPLTNDPRDVRLTGSIEDDISSLTPRIKEFFTINAEPNMTLYESGVGESVVLQELYVVTDTISRPELELSYYDEHNTLQRMEFPTQTPGNASTRFRADSITEPGNAFFEFISFESGNYRYKIRKPMIFPNGFNLRTYNVDGSNVVILEVLR